MTALCVAGAGPQESSFADGDLEPSVGPAGGHHPEYSGRLSPGPAEGNGYGDAFPTTSAPSPRRTRGRSRTLTAVKADEEGGPLDEEVEGRQLWQHAPGAAQQQQQQHVAANDIMLGAPGYAPEVLANTFVQCENVDCMKWRKVRVADVDPQGRWVCAMNPDARCAALLVCHPACWLCLAGSCPTALCYCGVKNSEVVSRVYSRVAVCG